MENLLINEALRILGRVETNTEFYFGATSCALISDSGKVYTGLSVNITCGLGWCSEQAAIAQMVSNGETRIKMLVAFSDVTGTIAPCGKCREIMVQIDKDNTNTKIVLPDGKVALLKDLLPWAWQVSTLEYK